MSANSSQIVLAILQSSPQIVAGISLLINHFRSQNPTVSFTDTVNKFFADLGDDEKAYLANQAEIAADVAANVQP